MACFVVLVRVGNRRVPCSKKPRKSLRIAGHKSDIDSQCPRGYLHGSHRPKETVRDYAEMRYLAFGQGPFSPFTRPLCLMLLCYREWLALISSMSPPPDLPNSRSRQGSNAPRRRRPRGALPLRRRGASPRTRAHMPRSSESASTAHISCTRPS